MRLWGLVSIALAGAPLSAAAQPEVLSPDRVAEMSWQYSLRARTLELRACGPFRPGDRHPCARAQLSDPRIVEESARILRLPKEKIGLVIEPAAKEEFQIVGLSLLLLKAPGVPERPAQGRSVQISGESLTEVRWTYSLKNRHVTLRVCGKLASPDYHGCAERHEKRSQGIRRLFEILLLDPVERLQFQLAWDASERKFTAIERIGLTSR
jgi:hypothetical protein